MNVGCDREDSCVTRIVWEKLNNAINDVVDNITLEDLLDWQAETIQDYVI
jgi:DNA-binding IscR family transcriptional regulator